MPGTRNKQLMWYYIISRKVSREISISWNKHDINFSWNFSRDNAICNKTRVIYHVIRAFIYHGIKTDVCIWVFIFISEVDSEEMAAFVSILRTKLTPLIYLSPDKKYV